ncbi:hypothetical protein ACP70R_031246 [Stipagrostis hirtigluma subsp. patula]
MEPAAAGTTISRSPSTERHPRRGGKRAREEALQLLPDQGMKKEDDEGEPGGAAAGIVAFEDPPAKAPLRVDRAMLRCSLCSLSLKSPIYQCRVKLPDSGCRTCPDGGGAYAHCPGLDVFFAKVHVPCPYERYGCDACVPYHQAAAHQFACDHAPCFCPEPGCAFAGSPPMLLAHLTGTHSWPFDHMPYGTSVQLTVPVPPADSPARHRRLLVGGDDASLFLMAVGPLGDGAAVSLVRVRANAPPQPRFTCKFLANAPPEAADLAGAYYFATVPVRSSALAFPPEKGLYFAVPREMLRCARTPPPRPSPESWSSPSALIGPDADPFKFIGATRYSNKQSATKVAIFWYELAGEKLIKVVLVLERVPNHHGFGSAKLNFVSRSVYPAEVTAALKLLLN